MVELLTVIVIVGILITLGFMGTGSLVERSRQAGCVSNLRQIGVALQSYMLDHDAQLPAMQSMRRSVNENVPVMDTVLLPYANDAKIFRCPSDRGKIWEKSGSSYWWYETVTLKASGDHNYRQVALESFFLATSDLSKIPLILDKESFHSGPNKVNALYADGHAGPLQNSNPNPNPDNK